MVVFACAEEFSYFIMQKEMLDSLLARHLYGADAVGNSCISLVSCGETHARCFRLLLGSVLVFGSVGSADSGENAEENGYFLQEDEVAGSSPARGQPR